MRLRLEPVDYRHLSFLKNLRNHPEVIDFCRQPNPLNDVAQEDWFKSISKNGSMLAFVVADDDLGSGKEWVGYAALSNFDWIADKAECSYVIHPDFKGRGYGEEAVYQLLFHAFYKLGLQKVYSDTFDYNIPEIELNKFCGFAPSGVLPRHYFKRGKFIDSIPMFILREVFDGRYKDRLSKLKWPEGKPL